MTARMLGTSARGRIWLTKTAAEFSGRARSCPLYDTHVLLRDPPVLYRFFLFFIDDYVFGVR
jgi:hypothetical protein